MRNEYVSLKNKINDAQSIVLCQDLYAQLHTKFIEYKKLTRKAKRKYEIQFHNELNQKSGKKNQKNEKSENCKDYWAALNEHSPYDSHKFVIYLEVSKILENLNRNPRNNHVTSILNSQLIVKSYTSENKDINIPFTVQKVTAPIKRLKNKKSAGIDDILIAFLKHCPNDMYVAITQLFNLALDTGIVPTDWCIGLICPIYKNKRQCNDPDKYRGITLLSCIIM